MADIEPADWRSRQLLYGGTEDEPNEPPRRHYTEPQLARCPHYQGAFADWAEADVRALFADLIEYFDLSGVAVPFPPTGLPGALHRKYDWNDPARSFIWAGVDYFRACARGNPRSMLNTWDRVNAKLTAIEERAPKPVRLEWTPPRSLGDPDLRPKLVYFIGAESGPIKIGMAIDPASRLAGLQTSHHEKLSILATREGGQERERAYHARFAASRLNGEWFDRTPELLAEIARVSEGDGL